MSRAGYAGVITDKELQNGTWDHDGDAGTDDIKFGFGVYGYLHTSTLTDAAAITTTPNFMWNEQVTYNGTKWVYDPIKYWPNGEDGNNAEGSPSNSAVQDNTNSKYLSFYAYAPWVSAGAASTGITAIPANDASNLKISYQLPTNITNASTVVDLLWGKRGNTTGYGLADGTDAGISNQYNVNLTKQNTTETVDFLFKHALAKIAGYDNTNHKSGLKVVYDIDGNGSGLTGFGATDPNTLVTIKEVTIKNTVDGSDKSNLYAKGDFDISTGTWSNQTKDNTINPTVNITIAPGAMNADIAETTPTHSTSWNPIGVTTTAKDVYKEGTDVNPIFFIPGVAQELEVEVEYVVRTYDAGLNNAASGGEGTWTKVTQKIKNTVTLPATTQPNKYYTLVMHLGLTSVKFSALVDNWEGATVGDGAGENPQEIWLPSNVVEYTATNNVTASATSTTIDLSGFTNFGTYTNYTETGDDIVSAVSVEGTTATLTLSTNTTSSAKSSTVTLKGSTGKVVVTLNQAAATISFGTPSTGTFSVEGPTDLDLSSATISVSKSGTDYTYSATADADHFSYDNSTSPKTITLPTDAGTYSVTVTQNQATLTQDVTRD